MPALPPAAQSVTKTGLSRSEKSLRKRNLSSFHNDKRDPTDGPEQFAYLLSYDNALSERAADFYLTFSPTPKENPHTSRRRSMRYNISDYK
jgi:hypothetical protein